MTCMTVSTFVYAFAQADCAVSVCSEASSHSNIAMILDAGLLLASIIILPMIILVHHFFPFVESRYNARFPFDPLRIGPENTKRLRRFDGALFLFAFAPVIAPA